MRKKLLINIFVFCLILSYAQSHAQSSDGAKSYHELAISLQKQRKYKEAEYVFSQGIKKYPANPRLYFDRGKLKQEYMGDSTSAMNDFTMTIKLLKNSQKQNFMHSKAYYKRGLCLYARGLFHDAMNDFNHSIRIKPNYARVYLARAKTFAKFNDIKNVKKNLQLAVKYNPKWTRAANSIWEKTITGKTDF